ncbi:MAG: hypothetical protein GYB66_14755 [Chloroflexi bacterium]|nr:hypothetical protein [Chloroflexota bacterium]
MYDVGSLHTIMAGSGKPQKVLTDLRKQIIRALHDQHSLSEIQVMFGLAHGALIAELTPLVDASLVAKRKDTYQPLFFVADADETRRVAAHATTAGEALFAQLQTDWEALSQAYQALEISRRIPFPEIAFLLVGANILDIGLLRALEQDGTLMPPSPHRPSPDAPDAHYYF